MIVQSLSFYLFATLLLASGVMVISARNPVHSVLFLILAFFQAAGLCVLMGAEFLAMILVIVYVGAVAVLFLFVVMMLDINLKDLRAGFLQYLPIGGLVGLVLLLELVMVLGPSLISHSALETAAKAKAAAPAVTNTEALGQLVYTHYVYLFQASGIVLLIAMIGAIVLTLRQREGVRKQNVSAQLARRRDETVTIRKVSTGGGI